MLDIVELNMDMAYAIHTNSLDKDTRRFLPDEVFETVDEARSVISELISCYSQKDAPQVYAVVLDDSQVIGYVQAVPIDGAWEVGYKIAMAHTGRGYATQALKIFLPQIMERLAITQIYGVTRADNPASCKVLKKCGFTLEFEGIGKYQGSKRPIRRYRLDI